jgi:hypothetical protein
VITFALLALSTYGAEYGNRSVSVTTTNKQVELIAALEHLVDAKENEVAALRRKMKPTETLIVKMQFGSHVYGTNLPTSDLDFKGVYVPTADDILLQRVKASRAHSTKEDRHVRNSAEDVDFEIFSLQQFFNLLLAGQTVQVSMLFTPQRWIVEQTELWDLIRSQKDKWLHSGVAAFAGYCRQQANKYGIKGSRVSAAAAAVDTFSRIVSNSHADRPATGSLGAHGSARIGS